MTKSSRQSQSFGRKLGCKLVWVRHPCRHSRPSCDAQIEPDSCRLYARVIQQGRPASAPGIGAKKDDRARATPPRDDHLECRQVAQPAPPWRSTMPPEITVRCANGGCGLYVCMALLRATTFCRVHKPSDAVHEKDGRPSKRPSLLVAKNGTNLLSFFSFFFFLLHSFFSFFRSCRRPPRKRAPHKKNKKLSFDYPLLVLLLSPLSHTRRRCCCGGGGSLGARCCCSRKGRDSIHSRGSRERRARAHRPGSAQSTAGGRRR